MKVNERGWDSSSRAVLLMVFSLAALFIFFMLDLILGSVNIPFQDTLAILLGNKMVNDSWQIIIMDMRLPKAFAAAFGGAALAVAGLLMQTLFRNPLAGPFTLGISSGASLGVAIVILLVGGGTATTIPQMLAGLGSFGSAAVAIAAFAGSSAVLMIVLFISRKVESSVTILILGLMFGYAATSLVTILVHFSDPEKVKAFTEWTYGSFDIRCAEVSILVPIISIALISSFLLIKPLNALLLGEKYAESMGMNFKTTRHYLIIITALLAGTVTAFCGPIAFLGVAVPHLCRGLFLTADHRILVPGCIILGGSLALFSDLVAHLPGSNLTLPLSAVTSMLGAPVIIWVVLRGNKLGGMQA
ncbi:iron ABC transporter permease [Methanolobus vulcani]|uniref:Iron ABC transporter permease n=1 Tax=Methanolobus vulcani TaxID=38026 RepID=A0A7Z8P3F6_9EURY|nr:iron ABC transporter permease [Methanolobus vulcani]TQD29542.1 iron ABC transporter permease [Methanolobus vulcani]